MPSLKDRRVRIAGLLALLAIGLIWWFGRGKPPSSASTFAARRGPLLINLLEGGSLEARQSQEIRSEVKGYQGTKILSVVEEGYFVTEDDVKKGKILVDLDSSDLKQRIIQQNIQYQTALASFIDSQQAYSIQINQSKSDIKLAEQKAKFALMDLEKYLGAVATKEILARVDLPYEALTNETAAAEQTLLDSVNDPASVTNALLAGNGTDKAKVSPAAPPRDNGLGSTNALLAALGRTNPPPTAPSPPTESAAPVAHKPNSLTFDFTEYVDEARLGDGAAKQNLRKLKDDVYVAETDLNVAQTRLNGTRRLFEKKFVSKTELDNDEITVKKNTLRNETAVTALGLFRRYEFTKAAEESLSKYEESLQGLDRARKEAVARLAQARARFRSAEGQHQIQTTQFNELKEQLEKCTIRATKSGLVVYGSGGGQRFYNNEEQIREGATVRERQPILTIPDMTQMAVRVKIPEAHIKKIKKAMRVKVQVDAFPDEQLVGEVSKVGVLPDSQDRWLNPDLKVYTTTVSIEGNHEWVRPGMSAKVEILIKQLDDVVYVPVQAVVSSEGKHYCYVGTGSKPDRRDVQVGDFNDEFIAIREGIREGDIVQLRTWDTAMESGSDDEKESAPNGKPAGPKPDARPPKTTPSL
jgi:multidrug efflux pump subunit AcrA (membrane-fusion protein)